MFGSYEICWLAAGFMYGPWSPGMDFMSHTVGLPLNLVYDSNHF